MANIVRAMNAAHEAGIPVVVVQHVFPEGLPVFACGSHGAARRTSVRRAAGYFILKAIMVA